MTKAPPGGIKDTGLGQEVGESPQIEDLASKGGGPDQEMRKANSKTGGVGRAHRGFQMKNTLRPEGGTPSREETLRGGRTFWNKEGEELEVRKFRNNESGEDPTRSKKKDIFREPNPQIH